HTLLKGKKKQPRRRSSHGFSSSQIQSLAAICQTLIPPLADHGNKAAPHSSFFDSPSGSEEVAELLVKRGVPQAVFVVGLVLWVLSTRLGTLLLCGFTCLDWRSPPFLPTFSELQLSKREAVLQRWSRQGGTFLPLRITFLLVKIMSFFTFFSRTDENSQNPAWESIGYHIETPVVVERPLQRRPLQNGIIETITESSLRQKGLRVITEEDDDDDYLNVDCDVVVVGSGCGGSVAAAILAKSGHKVVVLEKGHYFAAQDYSGLEGPSLSELYESGAVLSTLGGELMIMAGSTVGGGSAINWSACIRTPDHILDEWSKTHNLPLYRTREYQSAMDAVCERIGVTDACDEEGFQNQVLRRGCESLGLKVDSVPRNSPSDHYCGSCGYGCRRGAKRGADSTWLVDAVDNSAVIMTGCKAERFILAKDENEKTRKRCIGVIATAENIEKKLKINARVTISACGSLSTPPLLISSGLKNKNIGRNLHLHPVSFIWGYFPETDTRLKGTSYEGGIITSIHKVQSEERKPAVQAIVEAASLGPGAFSSLFPWTSRNNMDDRMRKYSRTAVLFTLVRDEGSGEVKKLKQIQYKLSEVDKENLKTGMRRALRILIAAGATEAGTFRSDGQRIWCKGTNDDAVEEFLDTVVAADGPRTKSMFWNIYGSAHQMGSCRMGRNEDEGAVDERGESWEAKGLFVCDGSLLPTAVGVNPMVSILATAYCVANRIAESMKQ
ncbi:hypothetical protein M569_07992, partial [Genlisea aurea]